MSQALFPANGQGLQGKRILITRPRDLFLSESPQDDGLQRLLREWGAEVHWVPLIEIQPFSGSHHPEMTQTPQPDSGTQDATQRCISTDCRDSDWLFFTSKNAVHAFFREYLTTVPAGVGAEGLNIAVVGPATAECVTAYGYTVSFIAPQYHAEAAAQAFCEHIPVKGLQVLWPCGNLAQTALPDILQAAGATVTPLVVYETQPKKTLTIYEQALFQTPWDMLVFTSPSAIQAWLSLAAPLGLSSVGFAVATLGPKTTQAALTLLGRVDVQAETHTLEGLAQAIRKYWREDSL